MNSMSICYRNEFKFLYSQKDSKKYFPTFLDLCGKGKGTTSPLVCVCACVYEQVHWHEQKYPEKIMDPKILVKILT